jgi:hypothetical protein
VLTGAVAAAAVVLARRRIADAGDGSGAAAPGGDSDSDSEDGGGWRRVRIAAVLAAGAGLLEYAGSGLRPVQLAAAAAGVALLVPTAPRLLPRGALRAAGGLPAVVLLSGLASGVYFTLESFVPLLLIDHRQVPASLAGTAFTGATIGWAGASWLQGHLWSGVPRHRLVAAGTAMATVGAAVAVLGVPQGAPRLTAAAALVLAGAGMGLVVPGLTVLAFDYCRPEEQGHYSAALQVAQSLGQVLVMAVAGALYAVGTAGGRAGGGAFTAVFALLSVLALGTRLLAPRTGAPRSAAHTDVHHGG